MTEYYLIGYFDSDSQTWQRDGRLGIKLQVEGVQVIEAFRQGLHLFHNNTAHLVTTPTIHPSNRSPNEDVPYCYRKTSGQSEPHLEPKDPYPAADTKAAEIEVEIMTQLQPPLVEDLDQHTTEDIKVGDVMTEQPTGQAKVKRDRVKPGSSPASTKKQQQKSSSSQKGQSTRPDLEADDLDRMRGLMAGFGVVGSSSEVFAALLDRFEQLQQLQQQAPTLYQDLETIRWFTREIDSLRGQIAAIEQEKEQLKVSAAQVDEIANLRDENALLKRQLQQNQAVLDNLRGSLAQVGFIGAEEALTSAKGAATMPPSFDTQEPTPNLSHASATPANTNGSGATTDRAIASASPPSTPPKPAKKTRSGAEQTAAKIHQILDALIAWNAEHTQPQQRIRIGILPVKAFASKMGADHQAQIQAALQQRSEEIEQMHQRLLLGSKHNRSLFNKDELLQAIARDLLHLNNWQDVRYPA